MGPRHLPDGLWERVSSRDGGCPSGASAVPREALVEEDRAVGGGIFDADAVAGWVKEQAGGGQATLAVDKLRAGEDLLALPTQHEGHDGVAQVSPGADGDLPQA